jgi:hypothetical protein
MGCTVKENLHRTQPPSNPYGTCRVGNCLVVIWCLQIAPSKRREESSKMLKELSMSL